MFGVLTAWVINVVEALGYLGVAFLVAIENLFPPIPSEVVLSLAGFVASRGDASLFGMVFAATIGSLVGAWILYGAAAALGPVRLRAFVLRHHRWLRVTAADLDRSEAWFDRRSNLAVLACRCVPLVRSLISLPAGFRHMPLVPFTIYTTIGSLIWNAALVSAGFYLGERWELVEQYADYLQYAVLGLVAAAVVGLGWRRFRTPQSPEHPPAA